MVTDVAVNENPCFAETAAPFTFAAAFTSPAPMALALVGDSVVTAWPAAFVNALPGLTVPRPPVTLKVTT